MDAWKNLDAIERYSHTMRLPDFCWSGMVPVGWNLLAGRSRHSLSFIRVPRTTAGRQGVEEWRVDIPVTPFQPCAFAVYSPEDVLAFVEWRQT